MPIVRRGQTAQLVLNGLPLWGNAMPWKVSSLTPNMNIDQTDDIRPDSGAAVVPAHLQRFVDQGGLFLAAGDAAKFAIDMGLAPGVSVAAAKDLKVVGSVLKGVVVDAGKRRELRLRQEIMMYSPDGLSFQAQQPADGRRRIAEREGLQAPHRSRWWSARHRCTGGPRRGRGSRVAIA